MADKKLDIFYVLEQIDQQNFDFYASLSAEEQKSPFKEENQILNAVLSSDRKNDEKMSKGFFGKFFKK